MMIKVNEMRKYAAQAVGGQYHNQILSTDSEDQILFKLNLHPELVDLFEKMILEQDQIPQYNCNIIPALHRYHQGRADLYRFYSADSRRHT